MKMYVKDSRRWQFHWLCFLFPFSSFLLFIDSDRTITSVTAITGELPKRATAEAVGQTPEKIGR
jgi:hypothetical protein